MELPGKRELREQILHQMDGRTSYVSDKDVYREIDKAILRSSHGGYGTLSEKEELRRQMFYIASKEPGFLMENCLFSYSWKGSLAAGGVKLNFVKQCSY